VPGTVEVSVTERFAHNYGNLQLSLIVPRQKGRRSHVPERELARILDCGVRRIQDTAVPALEELVERQEAVITTDEPVEAAVQEPVLHGIGAKVHCAVMAEVDPQSVEDILRNQVLVPLERELNAPTEYAASRDALVVRVQKLVRRLGGPIRR
jgi:hypothetical protein